MYAASLHQKARQKELDAEASRLANMEDLISHMDYKTPPRLQTIKNLMAETLERFVSCLLLCRGARPAGFAVSGQLRRLWQRR